MKIISPLLGYTLKTFYQPLEMLMRYRQLRFRSDLQPVRIFRNCPYGDHPQQQADIFIPTGMEDNNSLPVVIYVHGGGWIAGDKSLYTGICQKIASQGFVVFNLNYRLAPRFTYQYQIQDLNFALRWITDQCSQFRGDETRLFLMGDTSGANLICTYSVALNHPYLRNTFKMQGCIDSRQLKGLLLLYGTYDLERGMFANVPFLRYWHEAFLGKAEDHYYEELVNLASPLRHLHYHLPPVFIAAAEVDPLFSQSVFLARKLKEMQHTYATAFYDREQYPDGQHLFFSLQHKPCSQQMLKESLFFLKLHASQLDKTNTEQISAIDGIQSSA